MRKITTLFAVVALAGSLTANDAYAGGDDVTKARTPAEALVVLNASEAAAIDAATWKMFSKNLVRALRMDHDGVRLAVLQYVIRYNDRLDVDEAAIDVARIYRNHKDDNVRRMAVVALSKMQSGWAIGYLRLSAHYEKTEAVRHTIQAVVAAHEAAHTGPTAKKGA